MTASKALRGILRRMKRGWQYYRLIAHIAHNADDFDADYRRTTDDCERSHTTVDSVRSSYNDVIATRLRKSKRWHRLISKVTGLEFKGLKTKRSYYIISDLLSGAREEKYIKIHPRKNKVLRDPEYICLTNKGERLIKFPIGTVFGMSEYWFNSYPRTVFVLFTALVAFLFGILGVILQRAIIKP